MPPLNTELACLALQQDGKIIAGGGVGGDFPGVARFHADGSHDPSFSFRGISLVRVFSVDLLPDGKVLLAANWATRNGLQVPPLIRLHADGQYDESFVVRDSLDGTESGFNVLAESSGKILVYGGLTLGGRYGIARLNPDGALDSSFHCTLNGPVHAMLPAEGDRTWVAGGFFEVAGKYRPGLAKINSSGEVDPGFVLAQGAEPGQIRGLAAAADGKLVLYGDFQRFAAKASPGLVRVYGSNSELLGVEFDSDSYIVGENHSGPIGSLIRFGPSTTSFSGRVTVRAASGEANEDFHQSSHGAAFHFPPFSNTSEIAIQPIPDRAVESDELFELELFPSDPTVAGGPTPPSLSQMLMDGPAHPICASAPWPLTSSFLPAPSPRSRTAASCWKDRGAS